MKRIFIFVILSVAFSFSVHANYIDGNLLKSMSVAPVTDNAHLQFVGYVIGVIDSDAQHSLCVNVAPNALIPVLEAVIDYLDSNPPGNKLVIEALLPKYSCSFKAKSESSLEVLIKNKDIGRN